MKKAPRKRNKEKTPPPEPLEREPSQRGVSEGAGGLKRGALQQSGPQRGAPPRCGSSEEQTRRGSGESAMA